jgi:hypothetical protein
MPQEGNGQSRPYKVEIAKKRLETVKELHRHAAKSGRGKEFLAALRQIYSQLCSNPREFCEPLYRLPALNLMVYQASVNPLVVSYAVHEEKHLVFVTAVRMFQYPQ